MEKESRTEKIMAWIVLLIYALIAAGLFYAGYLTGKDRMKPLQPSVSVTTNTAKHISPKATSTVSKGYVRVPVVAKIPTSNEPKPPNNGIIIIKQGDSGSTLNLPEHDTDSALIPIEQKVYKDSNYTAWVSGYQPKLDSIFVVSRTATIIKTVPKYRRWNVGITGGYGYGFFSKRFEPYIGVGITVNLLK